MNRVDIKLVIDQLDQLECSYADTPAIDLTIATLETLGNKVRVLEGCKERSKLIAKATHDAFTETIAEQAAVIEKLREALDDIVEGSWDLGTLVCAQKALATPTDSKQILIDWMREQLGEPTAYFFRDDPEYFAMPGSGFSHEYPKQALDVSPLYKQPEMLK